MYFFGITTGAVQTGLIEYKGDYYYGNPKTGELESGIRTANQKGYYFAEPTFKAQKGWIHFNNENYYADDNYQLKQGAQLVDNNYYFFGMTTFKTLKGWINYQGKTYYADEETGILNTSDNALIDNNYYSFNNKGELQKGWQTINGNTYYFYADGTKAKYIAKIAGVRYEFSANGELEHSNIKVIADLSKHNGIIDWNALWSSGEIDGVILRIGYSLGMDSKFKTYLSEAQRLNIPYSVYHFSIAENAYEANLEANNLISWYKETSLNPVMGVFYDIESWVNNEDGHTSDNISKEMYDTIISTYKTSLNNNGIAMSLYTGKNYAEQRLTQYGRDQIGWIAHYASVCGYKGNYRGWQYTSKGRLPGVNGNVDLSIFYY